MHRSQIKPGERPGVKKKILLLSYVCLIHLIWLLNISFKVFQHLEIRFFIFYIKLIKIHKHSATAFHYVELIVLVMHFACLSTFF